MMIENPRRDQILVDLDKIRISNEYNLHFNGVNEVEIQIGSAYRYCLAFEKLHI